MIGPWLRTLKRALLLGAVLVATAQEARAISGGEAPPPRAFPFMVSIRFDHGETSGLCGGTLIARQWLMTAAHCFRPDQKPADVHVFVGSDRLFVGEDIPAAELKPHPDYNHSTHDNDIALIRLSRPPRQGGSVASVKLSANPKRYDDLPPGTDPRSPAVLASTRRDVKVIGWGRVGPVKTRDEVASTLQMLDVRVTSGKYCESRHNLSLLGALQDRLRSLHVSEQDVRDLMTMILRHGARGLPAGAFCASKSVDMFGNPVGTGILGALLGKGPELVLDGAFMRGVSIQSEPDSCPGDSGGPVLAKEPDGTWVQVGIVSYGVATNDALCGLTLQPSVYTNVGFYDAWVRSILSGR